MLNPIRFRAPTGGVVATGYDATILPNICDAVLAARDAGALRTDQLHIAKQCEILVRGLARVGIIALVDEATGYQRDRTKDALAKILEAFIDKELQPWVLAVSVTLGHCHTLSGSSAIMSIKRVSVPCPRGRSSEIVW